MGKGLGQLTNAVHAGEARSKSGHGIVDAIQCSSTCLLYTSGPLGEGHFARKTRGPGIVYLGPNVELMDLNPTAPVVKEASRVAISAHFS